MWTYLCLLSDGLVNDVVIFYHLFLHCVRQILHASILLLKIDVAQTTVEEDLARVELKEQSQLCVVNHCVAAKVEQRVVEVCQCFLEVAQKEVRDTLLEIGDSEILVQTDSTLVAFDLESESAQFAWQIMI